jgi:hypothetical protein
MDEFSVEMDLTDLLSTPVRFREIRFEGMRIHVPPKQQPREEGVKNEQAPGPPRELPPFLMERISAHGTVLRLIPSDPEKKPLAFELHELELQGLGPGSPMLFEALLDIPKPPGRIRTKGSFGPMDLDRPELSPIGGEYTFSEADLSVFGGIGGTLTSEGRYAGSLAGIEVDGFADIPAFYLKSRGSPVHLWTEFAALVDGTSGDTWLRPVRARLETSEFTTEGGVAREEGREGKTVRLKATSTSARVEDFLRLVAQAEPPFLSGDLFFESLIVIPPEKTDVTEKLELDGEFSLESAQFHDPEIQKKLAELSRLASVRSDRSKTSSDNVVSDMRGRFVLQDGVMTFRELEFAVPGARVDLTGTYRLEGGALDFRGELLMDARVSETTTGLAATILKAVDPLFSRRGAGTVVPIKVTGTQSEPSFGVEFGRVLSNN